MQTVYKESRNLFGFNLFLCKLGIDFVQRFAENSAFDGLGGETNGIELVKAFFLVCLIGFYQFRVDLFMLGTLELLVL